MQLLIPKLIAVALLFFFTETAGQKRIQLDETFKNVALEFEPRAQSHRESFRMTSFSFDSFKVVELKNNWERNGYWALYLKEKNIKRVTQDRRSGYSFQFVQNEKDTANVAVLFEKTTPEGFFITSSHSKEKLRLSPEVITAFIQTTIGEQKWQAVMYEAPSKFLGTEWTVLILSDSLDITSAAVERWENGKKPVITGPYGLGTAFYKEGVQIGAIQYPGIVSPRIWISKELPAEEKLLIAALMETLLIIAADLTEIK